MQFTDYVDPSDLPGWLKSGSLGQIDCIFHLGACSSTTETNEKYLRENNFEYSRRLAEWALGNGVRFVYASSAATYGNGEAGMDDADPAQLERLHPLNLYGLSKHWMDLHAWKHGWLDKIAGLKYFNVFGPNENHKGDMRSVVCKSYAQALETGVIHLFKSHRPDFRDGEQRRDFLYVKDAVAMTLHLAANPRGERNLQHWLRKNAHLERTGPRRLCRARPTAPHRIHRHARIHPRKIPVLDASRHKQIAFHRV